MSLARWRRQSWLARRTRTGLGPFHKKIARPRAVDSTGAVVLSESDLSRSVLIYGACALLAMVLGFALAVPLTLSSFGFVLLVLLVLGFPLLMRWHHSLLILCWNASMIFFFLPGQPALWTVLAGLSLFISVLNHTLKKRSSFIRVPSLEWPLILLLVVVAVTIIFTGGIRGRAFGSESWGAKRYLGVLGAVFGYFALVAQPISPRRAPLYAALFFLSGMTSVFSDLAYAAGPAFYFLFALFPSDVAFHQATTQTTLQRFTGLAWMAQAGGCFMLVHYGIRGIFVWQRPWRLLGFVAVFAVGLLGGFRSSIILFFILFACQFYFEGLFRSRLLPFLLVSFILVGSLVIGYVDRLPLSVQRSLSFLPIHVHPMAKQDAAGTLDWRLQIWKTVWPDVPKYLLLGKGFTFSGTDMLLTQEAQRRGFYSSYETTLINGNYHSGPLTVIIPFGIFGVLAFVVFCWNSLRVLRSNYRYGDKSMAKINTFLLAYFTGRLIFYLIFYGQFDLDLMLFTGTVGLSICLNGGVKKPAANKPKVAPAVRPVPADMWAVAR